MKKEKSDVTSGVIDNGVVEANFDGLVGPTHNYGGLSYGNVASTANRQTVSNPREAALQGLAKMKALAAMGLYQGVIPPQERPHLPTLRRLGFSGTDAEVVSRARAAMPLLVASTSAACMFAANSATVAASRDTADGKVHFTPANLVSKFHRSFEHQTTARLLAAIFPSETHFHHHPALPSVADFADEGAANHTRLCESHGGEGLHLFVFGRHAAPSGSEPRRFPARQTREASEAVARLHQLGDRAIFFQQSPEAIDAGAFHNDVVAVGNGNVLLYHQDAFLGGAAGVVDLKARFSEVSQHPLVALEVPRSRVSLEQAIRSYFFNAQLLTVPSGGMVMVVPAECELVPEVKAYLDELVADPMNPIREAKVFDLRQSMQNGGGPACLRLRVVLTPEERKATAPGIWMNDGLYDRLGAWVRKHYRDRLAPTDLADPKLWEESRTALDELTGILGLGSVYFFQR